MLRLRGSGIGNAVYGASSREVRCSSRFRIKTLRANCSPISAGLGLKSEDAFHSDLRSSCLGISVRAGMFKAKGRGFKWSEWPWRSFTHMI